MILYLFNVCTVLYRWLAWPILGAVVVIAFSAFLNPNYSATERVIGFLSGSASVIGGIILGVLWYEMVIFQVIYDFPRAIYWKIKGLATGGWGEVLLHAFVWGLCLSAAFYLADQFIPAFVNHPAFDIGRLIGIGAVILRQIVSSHARGQLRFCFLDRMRPYVTEAGYERTLELLEKIHIPTELLQPSHPQPYPHPGGQTMINKLVQFVGWAVIVIVLYGRWRYLLMSTRPPELKVWETCKRRLLENWGGSHTNQVKPLLQFTEDHFYSFGAESTSGSFDDHDSRGMAVNDAQKLGVSESELIQLDQRIAKECGPFPRS